MGGDALSKQKTHNNQHDDDVAREKNMELLG
jgi:hypothetical protein